MPLAPAPRPSHARPASRRSLPVTAEPGVLVLSCDDCSRQHTATCDDCVVSFLCDRDPEDAVVLDAEEARAVRVLAGAGLVPPLRHQKAG